MVHLITRIASSAIRHARLRALLYGTGLGWVAALLLDAPQPPAFRVAMALVVLGAGTVSFVLHELHLRMLRTRLTRAQCWDEARLNIVLVGCGVAFSLHALGFSLA
jgi:hypothetical protein